MDPVAAWPPSETLFVTMKHPGREPLVAVALHHGHRVRTEVAQHLALSDAERRREEDPFSAQWTLAAPTGIVALRSRFEVDLNRPRSEAVYGGPEQAWGLEVWKEPLPPEVVERSLATHDAFYQAMRDLLDGLVERAGCFVVFDLHSYNHRRAGPSGPPDDPRTSPDLNFGTASLLAPRWRSLVDRLIVVADDATGHGRALTVGENVRFGGGFFSTWVNERYGDRGCAIAIEVKKFYMDEWSGRLLPREFRTASELIHRLGRAARAALQS